MAQYRTTLPNGTIIRAETQEELRLLAQEAQVPFQRNTGNNPPAESPFTVNPNATGERESAGGATREFKKRFPVLSLGPTTPPIALTNEQIKDALVTGASGVADYLVTSKLRGASAIGKFLAGVAGNIAGEATDTAGREVADLPQRETMLAPDNFLGRAAETQVLGTALGAGIGVAGRLAGFIEPAVDPVLRRLSATTSGYLERNTFGRRVAELFEYAGSPSATGRQLEEVGEHAQNLIREEIGDIGQPGLYRYATEVQRQLRENVTLLTRESTSLGNVAKDIAELPELALSTRAGKVVHGPIILNNFRTKAEELLGDLPQILGKDPNAPIARDLISIVGQPEQTADGFVFRSLDFASAWENAKKLGEAGWGSSNPFESTALNERNARELWEALTNDIEESITKGWRAQAGDEIADTALASWRGSKAIAKTRNGLISPAGNRDLLTLHGAPATTLEHNITPTTGLNKIVDDPVRLQRLLDSGNIGINTKTGEVLLPNEITEELVLSGDIREVTTRNARSALQSYSILRAFEDSRGAVNQATGTFDATRLAANVKEFLASDSGKKLFNQETRRREAQWFKDLAETIAKVSPNQPDLVQGVGVSNYMAVRIATSATVGTVGGISLGAQLGIPSAVAGTIGTGAVFLTFGAIGNLLAKPSVAPHMADLLQGNLRTTPSVIGRAIARALRGQEVLVENEDGSLSPATVNADGIAVVQEPAESDQAGL